MKIWGFEMNIFKFLFRINLEIKPELMMKICIYRTSLMFHFRDISLVISKILLSS